MSPTAPPVGHGRGSLPVKALNDLTGQDLLGQSIAERSTTYVADRSAGRFVLLSRSPVKALNDLADQDLLRQSIAERSTT